MKNHIILALLLFCMSGRIAIAQTKKSTTTKKTTVVKPSATKITKTPVPTNTSQAVEQKKVANPSSATTQTIPSITTTTTTVQSTGPSSKGTKTKASEPTSQEDEKPVKEPKYKKLRNSSIYSDDEVGVKFGIRAEATQLYVAQSGDNYDLLPGVNAGLIINLPVSQVVSIQPEILYSMANAKISTDANNYVNGTVNTILVPMMANFNFGNGSTTFMLNLGGYGNYALSATSKVVVAGKTIMDGSVELGNDRFDYGAAIGLGVKLNNSFMIEARTFYSLKDNIGKTGIGTIGIGYLF